MCPTLRTSTVVEIHQAARVSTGEVLVPACVWAVEVACESCSERETRTSYPAWREKVALGAKPFVCLSHLNQTHPMFSYCIADETTVHVPRQPRQKLHWHSRMPSRAAFREDSVFTHAASHDTAARCNGGLANSRAQQTSRDCAPPRAARGRPSLTRRSSTGKHSNSSRTSRAWPTRAVLPASLCPPRLAAAATF